MRILISNDDGIGAKGLDVLRAELSKIGEVVAVVPERERSGASRAVSIGRPIKVRKVEEGLYGVEGNPTDCVLIAIKGLLKERPDIVVAGINHGPNLGEDVTYSGTVAAAMEGAMYGIPSMAISVVGRNEARFEVAATVARVFCSFLKGWKPRKRVFLNVNVPNIPLEDIKGIRVTRQGKRIYKDEVSFVPDPWGNMVFTIKASEPIWIPEEGTDFEAVEDGMIAVTPLQLDLTFADLIDELEGLVGNIWGSLHV